MSAERWLLFEIGGEACALPIAHVLEVSEVGRIGRVPSLPRSVGGVMHHHGDALPIVARSAVFEGRPADGAPGHVVVIADATGEAPRLGLPVDRVLGLADAPAPADREPGLVSARIQIDGRPTALLDTECLVSRAAEVIERAGSTRSTHPEHGGET